MAIAHKVRRKRKEHVGDLFWEVNSLVGNVYKKLSRKGGLLHGLMSPSKRTKTHKRRHR